MQIQEILYKGIKELKSQEIEEASLISKILLADILKCKREELINIAENNLNEKEENEFLSGIDRIKEGYPLEYITGKKEFMKMEFFVNENVLIPRSDTEILVEEIMNIKRGNCEILDLCTGSGAIRNFSCKIY
ncbi:MAG: hypothetical protein HFJ50_03635 [Clostridia bacterium]|jgi:release factor glutamine methyltransferase|nr:hypothetical protein [Clostridia bacterium]